MLALRCGPRLLGLLSGPRSAPLLLSTTRTCSDGGARGANSSSRNPLVYLDVGADGQPLGRVVLEVRLGHRENLDFSGPVLGLAHQDDLGPQFPSLKRYGISLVRSGALQNPEGCGGEGEGCCGGKGQGQIVLSDSPLTGQDRRWAS